MGTQNTASNFEKQLTKIIVNGTSYHIDTPEKAINVLENARLNKIRLLLDYGDNETGKSWNEMYDILGRVGRSSGSEKVPILMFNSNSIGGSCILDNCIVKISTSKGKQILYQHPNYHKII
jgi:hypothetical protein